LFPPLLFRSFFLPSFPLVMVVHTPCWIRVNWVDFTEEINSLLKAKYYSRLQLGNRSTKFRKMV
jgi:hypothetical protein